MRPRIRVKTAPSSGSGEWYLLVGAWNGKQQGTLGPKHTLLLSFKQQGLEKKLKATSKIPFIVVGEHQVRRKTGMWEPVVTRRCLRKSLLKLPLFEGILRCQSAE